MRQPTFFIPHGGGPCFFMDDPKGLWTNMAMFLRTLPDRLPEQPTAIIVVSSHWETDGFVFTGASAPGLIFDYNNFPPHTYALRYDVNGLPELAARAAQLVADAGLDAIVDSERGLDHGVFIPLKVMLPEATVPIVEMSIDRSLDPGLHLAAGRALSVLRGDGVLIIASGMSFHNMRGYGDTRFTEPSRDFDAWLTGAASAESAKRATKLLDWEHAPAARLCHPDAEHFLPFMVAAGASSGRGSRIFNEKILETYISGFQFD